MSQFSFRLTRSTSLTWKSQLLPTMVITGASLASMACMPSSSTALMPLRRVMPKAAILACLMPRRRISLKKALSLGLERG